jgi:hypothetical protein
LILPTESLRSVPRQHPGIVTALDGGNGNILLLQIKQILESLLPGLQNTLLFPSFPPVVRQCRNARVLSATRALVPPQVRDNIQGVVVDLETCRACICWEHEKVQ